MISIIVPVYNSEKTLKKCINSILNQTISDIQLILVDDGSKDNSIQICMQFEKKDQRIIFLQQKNRGPGCARNLGLKAAKGKYIQFVDSDDYLEPRMSEILYREIEATHSEMAICAYYIENKSKSSSVCLLENREYLVEEYTMQLLIKKTNIYFGAVWNKLYTAEVIQKYKIYFREDINMAEDLLFNCCMLSNISKVVSVNQSLYHYQIGNQNTLSVKKRNKKEYWINEKYQNEAVTILLKQKELLNFCQQELRNYVFYQFRRVLNSVFIYYRESLADKAEFISFVCRESDGLYRVSEAEPENIFEKILLKGIKEKKYKKIALLFSVKIEIQRIIGRDK